MYFFMEAEGNTIGELEHMPKKLPKCIEKNSLKVRREHEWTVGHV